MERKRGIAVGLTGNISSGKTTVMSLFEMLGCKVLSTDTIGHDLLEYNPEAKREIIDTFGDQITNDGGKIDRAKLGNIVFQDDEMRSKLEQILHPQIQNAAKQEIDSLPKGRILIIEAPLLFESHWESNVDHSILVTCPTEIRKKRYYGSGQLKAGDFERRDKAQWSEDKKAKLASFTIDNSKNFLHTKDQVRDIMKRLLSESFPRKPIS